MPSNKNIIIIVSLVGSLVIGIFSDLLANLVQKGFIEKDEIKSVHLTQNNKITVDNQIIKDVDLMIESVDMSDELPKSNLPACASVDKYTHCFGDLKKDGSVYYTGEILTGLPHGIGIWSLENYTYKGRFKKGRLNGYSVSIDSLGRLVDVGYRKENKRHGIGAFFIHDVGQVYRGQFKDGEYDGYGILQYNQVQQAYIGEYKKGAKHGKGKYIYGNGESYDGEWVHDFYEGIGKYTYSNGNIYQGSYKNGQFHGNGRVTWVNGDEKFGNFAMGKMHGSGKYIYANGTSEECDNYYYDLKGGKCIIRYDSGYIVEEHYEKGLRQGKAITSRTSQKEIANYKDGLKHGKLIRKYLDLGDNVIETYAHGVLEGSRIYTFHNGVVHKENYKDGKIHGIKTVTYANGESDDPCRYEMGEKIGCGSEYK